MFCSTLRERPLWKTLGPLIAASRPWKLQESWLQTHDLELRMPSRDDESYLPVLVLCPANTTDASLSSTETRLQQFAATTKGKSRIIAFVLDDDDDDDDDDDKQGNNRTSLDGLRHFMRLQTALFETDISCPALPVPDVALLLTTLDAYIRGIIESPPPPPKPDPTKTTPPPPRSAANLLLPYATASAPIKPLSQHNSDLVSKAFSSLRALEEATRTRQGREQLCSLVDSSITAEDIVEFWEDEWIV